MNLSVRAERSIPVLALDGRLDAIGAPALEAALQPLLVTGAHVAIDMTNVGYLSSVGIRALVGGEKALRARRGGLLLAGVTPPVFQILETAGLTRGFRLFANTDDAVEAAVAAAGADAAWSERAIDGRTYKIGPASSEPCVLEVWGALDEVPADPLALLTPAEAAVPEKATLDELGVAFGVGGLGSGRSQPEALGEFIAVGHLAGVALAEGGVSDFVLSDRPAEAGLTIAGAIGFAGPPSRVVELTTADPVRVVDVMRDVASLLEIRAGTIGLVLRTEGLLLVGAFPAADPGRLHAHGFLCDGTPKLRPGLDDVTAAMHVAPDTTIGDASLSLYVPASLRRGAAKRLAIDVDGQVAMQEEWLQIIRRLYRDCSRVILTQLVGGYMATTFRVASYDEDGRRLLPTVLKISTVDQIEREEEAHRAYVGRFILNNSTTIMGTAREGHWAALRYNFLGVSGADAKLSWLTSVYESRATADVLAVFDRLYTRILKPWYGQPRWEPVQLYADHTPLRLFPDVCAEAERQFGWARDADFIDCPEWGMALPNPFKFLAYEYPRRAAQSRLWYRGITHGDLNPRNVLVDEADNLYVIDFSETRARNIVADFARMEAVLKFDLAPLETPDDLRALMEYELGLSEARALDVTPPNRYRGTRAEMEKIHALICRMRQHANTVTIFETDIIPYWLACLEWTFSVICYDLPPLRKKWAAYSAAVLCSRIQELEGA